MMKDSHMPQLNDDILPEDCISDIERNLETRRRKTVSMKSTLTEFIRFLASQPA
jgi:hypothetical protein